MLRPQNTVVIVGYGDVYGEIAGLSGGYRRDSWMNMLAFPALAVIFGVVHNFIALRVYRKYGRDAAMMVVVRHNGVDCGGGGGNAKIGGEW